MVESQNILKGFQMNIKELNQLIESNTDLTPEEKSELYDLFLAESPEVFEYAHQATKRLSAISRRVHESSLCSLLRACV